MTQTMYETEKVKVTYDRCDLGMKYRAFTKADSFHTRVAFATLSEAIDYAKKLENGGK